jgi:cardiolipin synthase
MYEWHGRVMHAKTAIIDGHWCTVGSSNLDMQSLVFNLEVNVMMEHTAFARSMEAMFFEDLDFCEEITLEKQGRRAWWERLASWVAYLFRAWL